MGKIELRYFGKIFRDADGVISTSELGKLMRSLGKMPSEAEVGVIITQVKVMEIISGR